MLKPMTLYAVVLTFPGDIAADLSRLRKNYSQYVSYTIEPHLTLIFPLVPKVDIIVINNKLKAIAERTKPFTLVLSGVEYFEGLNNVAYIAIANKQPVIDLHVDIIHSLRGLIEDRSDTYELERFTPHVTIGEQIPDEEYMAVKRKFSDYQLYYEIEISSFILFSADEDNIWRPVCIFELTG